MAAVKREGSLAPLGERNFAWYFSSRLVNTLGAMMANIALTFAVLDIKPRRVHQSVSGFADLAQRDRGVFPPEAVRFDGPGTSD